MTYFSKASLAEKLAIRPEPFEAAGISLFVRRWTTKERQEFQTKHHGETGGTRQLYERLFAGSVCDESGALLFGPDDLDAIGGFNSEVVEAVALHAIKLNGMEGKGE